jgi:putative membrane protein
MSEKYSNKEEHDYFFIGRVSVEGAVTPHILWSIFVTGLYTYGLFYVEQNYYLLPCFAVTLFEYTGAVFGLVLVFRTNAGHERWWEARKFMGRNYLKFVI